MRGRKLPPHVQQPPLRLITPPSPQTPRGNAHFLQPLFEGSGFMAMAGQQLVDSSPRPLMVWQVDRPKWTTLKCRGFISSSLLCVFPPSPLTASRETTLKLMGGTPTSQLS